MSPGCSIPLTRGLVAHVDPQDYEALARHRWYAIPRSGSPGKFYAVRNEPAPEGGQRRVYMHREIMQPKKGEHVDHQDGDGLHNRRANLRCCTPQQNAWNKRLAIGPTPRGVKAVKTGWTAVITVDGERLRLGVFATLEAAAKAYDEAARALRGEYAVLNTQPARKPPPRGDRLALSDAADAHLTSFSRFKATWPKLCEEDGFPRPHILGGSAALIWSRSEIEDWKLAQERAIGAKLSRDFRRSQHPAKP